MGNCFTNSNRRNASIVRRENNSRRTFGTCNICFEETSLVKSVNSISNEHFRLDTCGHKFCTNCLKGYAKSEITSLKHIIRCPEVNCTKQLSDFDIERFASRDDNKTFRERKKTDYKQRLMSDIDDDMIKLLKIKEIARERRDLAKKKVQLKDGDIVDSPFKNINGASFRGGTSSTNILRIFRNLSNPPTQPLQSSWR